MSEQRRISVIAQEIVTDWKKVNYAAVPYLRAMQEIRSIHDHYHQDSAASVVRYFLANARSWRGDTAKRIKSELKSQLPW